MSLVGYALLFVFAVFFVLLAGWAFWRGPKLYSGWFDARNRRRGLEERRAELASEVLKSMRSGGANVPAARKPLVYLPDTIAEEPAAVDPPKSPWVSILIKPTATIRQIVDFDPQFQVMLLSCLYGINTLLGANIRVPNWSWSYATWLPIALIAGPLFGMFSVSLVSWVVRTTAEYLGGVASEHETQAAFAWSLLPEIYTFPLTLVTAIAISPHTSFDRTDFTRALFYLNIIASVVSHTWSFVIWLNTMAEVNRFSRWKAVIAMVLTFFVFLVAIVLVGAAFYLFAKVMGA